MFFYSEATAEHHINGKKHKRLVEMKTFRGMEAEHSIFVGGLSKLVSELALTDHFMQFGGIAKVFVDKDKVCCFLYGEAVGLPQRISEAEHSIFIGGLSKLVSEPELALTDHIMLFGGVTKVFVDNDKVNGFFLCVYGEQYNK